MDPGGEGVEERADGRPMTQMSLWADDLSQTGIERALIVREPWAGMIAAGAKRWEIRGTATAVRGTIAIAAAGTGTIVGVCNLCDVRGPLTGGAYADAWPLWGARERPRGAMPYPRTYAWVVTDARPIRPPLSYRHPGGAVVWVRLGKDVQERLAAALQEPAESESAAW